MRICITLDDVVRAKTRQFNKIYTKFIDESFVLDESDMKTNDLSEIFNFGSKKEYFDFLYTDYPFEIFGEAEVVDKMLDKNLTLWHMTLDNDLEEGEEPNELIFANPFEFNASIGYTCFFLSKIATRVREFYFPKDSSTIWDKCDVLITAEPKLLENKPEGKKSVKISMPYNMDLESDFTYGSLYELISDRNFLGKIKGTYTEPEPEIELVEETAENSDGNDDE